MHVKLAACIGSLTCALVQVAPAFQLRKVKEECEQGADSSTQQDEVQHKVTADKKGVSALKGFWETQTVAKR